MIDGQGRLDLFKAVDVFARWYRADDSGTILEADPRFVVVGHDLGRKDATYEVFCAACKLRLVVGGGKDPAPGVTLALSNVTVPVRACCEAWLPVEGNVGSSEGGEPDRHPPERILRGRRPEPPEREDGADEQQDDRSHQQQ
jgi:hypothetical protein